MKTTTRPLAPRRIPRRMPPRKKLFVRAATSEAEFDDTDGDSEPSMKLSHAFIVVLLLHILAVGGVFAFSSLKSKQIIPDRSAKANATKGGAKPASDDSALAPSKPVQSEPAVITYSVVSGDTLKRIAIKHKTSIEALEKANDITSTTTLHVGQMLRMPATKTSAAPAKPAAVATRPTAALKNQEVGASQKSPSAKELVVPKVPEAKAARQADTKPADPKADTQDAVPSSDKTDKAEKTYTVAQGDNPYAIAKKLKVSYNELLKANKIDDPKKLQIGQKLIVP